MEYRSQKAVYLTLALLTLPVFAEDFTFRVRHDHMLRDWNGTLTITERGVTYQETDRGKKTKKPAEKLHHGGWDYLDIQQFFISPTRVVIVLYQDRSPFLLGVDKEYEFTIAAGQDLKPVYEMLKSRLDRRFVAAIVDPQPVTLWQLPVKRLGTLKGSEGVLHVAADRIVFETARKEQSRTWRFEDIENVSTNDPYQLTLVTYERAVTHYGSRKDFNFQLKQPLDPQQFQLLWRRLNHAGGLPFLTGLGDTK